MRVLYSKTRDTFGLGNVNFYDDLPSQSLLEVRTHIKHADFCLKYMLRHITHNHDYFIQIKDNIFIVTVTKIKY